MTNHKQKGGSARQRKAPLYHLRKQNDTPIKDIADAIGVKSEVTVFRFENYQRIPSHRTAEKIGKLLGKSAGEIIDDYMKHHRRAS